MDDTARCETAQEAGCRLDRDHCSEPDRSVEVGDDGGRAGRANHGATYRVNKMSLTNTVGGSEAGERKSIR